jgi:hypothetical protein
MFEAQQLDDDYYFIAGMPRLMAMIGLEDEVMADNPGRFTGSWLASISGRTGEVVALTQAYTNENPSDLLAKQELGRALAADGQYAEARPILEEFWRLYEGRIGDGAFWPESAFALIAARRDAGDDDADVLRAMYEHVRRLREGGATGSSWSYSPVFEDGVVGFLSGDRELGLTLIAKAAEDGYFIAPNVAYFQDIYADPGFVPIREGQLARQKRERERLLEIVCSENPYEDVWQPLPSTCSVFPYGQDQESGL